MMGLFGGEDERKFSLILFIYLFRRFEGNFVSLVEFGKSLHEGRSNGSCVEKLTLLD